MDKKEIVKELLNNKFTQEEYTTLLGKKYFEYLPTNKRVDIIINNNIKIRTSNCDGRIRIEENRFSDDTLTFLDNYQDYWGGWFKNEINIPLKIIDTICITRLNDDGMII